MLERRDGMLRIFANNCMAFGKHRSEYITFIMVQLISLGGLHVHISWEMGHVADDINLQVAGVIRSLICYDDHFYECKWLFHDWILVPPLIEVH